MLQNDRLSTPIWKKIMMLIISIIVLSVQIALFYFAIIGSFYGAKILYTIGIVLSFIVIIFIINNESNASYKVTWICLIALMPLFFSVLYLFNYSSRKLPKRKTKKLKKYLELKGYTKYLDYDDMCFETKKLSELVFNDSSFPTFDNTNVTFFADAAKKHEDMMNKLRGASKYIFLEYFIISSGQLLNELIEVLDEKGKAGVEIKIIYDDIGSRATFNKKDIERLVNIPNLKLCVYKPLGLNLNPSINYRDHSKIVVIDGLYAYCGGDNLADEYIHKKDRFGYWRDNACLYEGSAVQSFLSMFITMWYVSTNETLNAKNYASFVPYAKANTKYVIPFGDGPQNETHVAYDTFQYLINRSNHHLYISTPYLIIDDEMLNAICQAKKCGVDVKILVPGIPDKKAVFMMTRAHYKTLLETGCEIYEFSEGFNHAKQIISDDKFAFLGTVNMDYRSLFLHNECGAVIVESDEILKMKEDFLDCCNRSKLVTLESWNNRNVFSKIMAFILRIFAPML